MPEAFMQLISYLTFSGNCRQAMSFYQKCLGGELSFQTVGAAGLSAKMPARMKRTILHAELRGKNMSLMATDLVGEERLLRGNDVSLLLCCGSEAEARRCFMSLSAGGEKKQALSYGVHASMFGALRDKFGIHWLIHYYHKSKKQHEKN